MRTLNVVFVYNFLYFALIIACYTVTELYGRPYSWRSVAVLWGNAFALVVNCYSCNCCTLIVRFFFAYRMYSSTVSGKTYVTLQISLPALLLDSPACGVCHLAADTAYWTIQKSTRVMVWQTACLLDNYLAW